MAVLTITTTAPQAARLATALGRKLGLMTIDTPPVPRDATAAEVKAEVIEYLRTIVRDQEKLSAMAAQQAAAASFDPA